MVPNESRCRTGIRQGQPSAFLLRHEGLLRCSKCGEAMRISAFVLDRPVIEWNARHPGRFALTSPRGVVF